MPLNWLYSICFTIIDVRFEISKVLDIAFTVLRLTTCVSLWYLMITFSIFSFVPSDNSLISSNYSFVFFLITPLVSYDYVICLIGHSIGIFISLRWDLLITPLVTSDYAFGIFWLPLWYHLITSMVPLDTLLVSSDHSIGIFRSLIWYLLILLPIWYLLIAPSIFPDCSLASCNFPFCIFWLPLWFIIPSSVSSDYPFCIFWYPLSYLLISPFDIFKLFVWWLLRLSITCWKKYRI